LYKEYNSCIQQEILKLGIETPNLEGLIFEVLGKQEKEKSCSK